MKELKELVIAVCKLSNVVVASLEDGKISISDLPALVVVFPTLITGIVGVNYIPAEFSTMNEADKAELVQAVKTELNLQENVELIVERALNTVWELLQLIELLKK